LPTLCEGGFVHPKRLSSPGCAEFARDTTILWLTPPDSVERDVEHRGRDHGADSRETFVARSIAGAVRLVALGARLTDTTNRDEALHMTCALLAPTLDVTMAEAQENTQNYR
jgi:hypothetical protein